MALYEYHTASGGTYSVYGTRRYGQQLTVGAVGTNENNTITFLKLRGYRVGSPGAVSVDVYAVDASGFPTGAVLSTGGFNGNAINTTNSDITVDMSSYQLAASTQYAFVISAASGDAANYIGLQGNAPAGCFLMDTPILLSDRSYKAIQDVKNGDRLFGYNESTGELQLVQVLRTFIHPAQQEYYLLSFDDGGTLSATGNHPLRRTDGYTPVERLDVGDEVFKIHDGKIISCRLKNKMLKKKTVDTYNLSVSDTNNYFAQNILVHNK